MLTLKNRKKLYFVVLHPFCNIAKSCIFHQIIDFNVEKRKKNY